MRAMNIQLEPSWKKVLEAEFEKPYFATLRSFLHAEIQNGQQIFPSPKNIFSAFDLCPFEAVKVVILGQDPYHSLSQVEQKNVPTAHGLCFSVVKGAPVPPSLKNIYKEIEQDLGSSKFSIPNHGNLESWARQGVLLLNATLTVRAHEAMSHAGKGWESFTDAAIRAISDEKEGVVFLLWGRHAQGKASLIDSQKHFILTAAHPSPFSAYNGFFGCHHFSKTNEWLKKCGKLLVDWRVD
jgi:uracil-DNA glycosylase